MPPRTAVRAAEKVKHLTEAELADRLRLSPQAVAKLRKSGKGPAYLPITESATNGTIRYPEAWVVEWENSRRVPAAST